MSSQNHDIPGGFRVTELGLLPEDWTVTSLGRLYSQGTVTIQTGFAEGGHNSVGDGVPHLRPFNVTSGGGIDLTQVKYVVRPAANSAYWIRKGDVVFNNTNSEDLVGKTAYFSLDGEFVLSNHMTRLRVKPNQPVDAQWLAYIMHHFFQTGRMRSASRRYVNQAAVTSARLKAVDFPLPPLPEQKTIAYVLSTIQKAIAAQDKIIAAARELKKSLMCHLFTYGPVPVAQAEHVLLKETEIGQVPERWEVVRLGEYCHFTTGKLDSNQAVPHGIYPFFTCSQETFRIDRYSFDCEAVLLSGNNARGIYSVKHYKGKFDAYQRTYVITIRNPDRLDYTYLKNVLETKLEDLRIGSIGTSTKFLTLKMLINLQISTPPLPEQQEIARILSDVDNKIEAEKNRKSALQALFKTMLHRLMTGKVRVNNLEASVS